MPSPNVNSTKLQTRSKSRKRSADMNANANSKRGMNVEVTASRKSTRLSQQSNVVADHFFDNAMKPAEVNLYTTWTQPTSYAFYSPDSRYFIQLKQLIQEAKLTESMKPLVTYTPQPNTVPNKIIVFLEMDFNSMQVPGANTIKTRTAEGSLKDVESVLRMDALNIANADFFRTTFRYADGSISERGFTTAAEKRKHFTQQALLDELKEILRAVAVLGEGYWMVQNTGSKITIKYRAEVSAPECDREVDLTKKKVMDPCVDAPLDKFIHTPISAYLFLMCFSTSVIYQAVVPRLVSFKGKLGKIPSSTSSAKRRRPQNVNAELQEQIAKLERIAEEGEDVPQVRSPQKPVNAKALNAMTNSEVKRRVYKLTALHKPKAKANVNANAENSLANIEEQGTVKVPGSVLRDLAKKNLLNSVVDNKKDNKTGKTVTRIYNAEALPSRLNQDKMYSVNFNMSNRKALEAELEHSKCEARNQGNVKTFVKCRALQNTLKNAKKLNSLTEGMSKVKIASPKSSPKS